MSNNLIALSLTVTILTVLVLWVPALDLCLNVARRLQRERAWHRFGEEMQQTSNELERDVVVD